MVRVYLEGYRGGVGVLDPKDLPDFGSEGPCQKKG